MAIGEPGRPTILHLASFSWHVHLMPSRNPIALPEATPSSFDFTAPEAHQVRLLCQQFLATPAEGSNGNRER